MPNNLQDLWGGAKTSYTINGPLAGALAGQASDMQRSQMQDQTLQEAIASRQKQAEYDRYNQMTPGMIQEQNGKALSSMAKGTEDNADIPNVLESQKVYRKLQDSSRALGEVAQYADSNLSSDSYASLVSPEGVAMGKQVEAFAQAHRIPIKEAAKRMNGILSNRLNMESPAAIQALAVNAQTGETQLAVQKEKELGDNKRNAATNATQITIANKQLEERKAAAEANTKHMKVMERIAQLTQIIWDPKTPEAVKVTARQERAELERIASTTARLAAETKIRSNIGYGIDEAEAERQIAALGGSTPSAEAKPDPLGLRNKPQ